MGVYEAYAYGIDIRDILILPGEDAYPIINSTFDHGCIIKYVFTVSIGLTFWYHSNRCGLGEAACSVKRREVIMSSGTFERDVVESTRHHVLSGKT